MINEILFLIIITIVAFLYASVGHGGASGYLALMVIFGTSPLIMKPSALLLNIFVSAISFYMFYKRGHFKYKLLIPFIISSIPLSFLGSKIHIDGHVYKVILAICLFIAIIRLVGFTGKKNNSETKSINVMAAVLIGGMIGFISGMIGIGGGILLSPVLLLLNWAKMKETAAISAAFIFLNSIAGLFGAFSSSIQNINSQIYIWAIAGMLGGTLGAYYGSKYFNNTVLKYVLSIVLIFACIKLVII
ncbi:MAG: sulfite exporter TauE/SafE family protein [Bacteroidetes bacterium]|nr:sulfite exporter TauE/SafE family protein [Bacteroidota bacterium]